MPLLSEDEIRKIVHNTVVRGRAKRWSDAKIERRIRWKVRLAKAWALRKKVPFRPFGGAIVGVGEVLEDTLKSTLNDSE